MKPKFTAPFSPYLMQTKVSKEFLNLVNTSADDVLADPAKINQWDASQQLVGKVTHEVQIPIVNEADRLFVTEEMRALGLMYLQKMIELDIAHNWFDLYGDIVPTTRNLGIMSAWIVSSRAGDYNPWHWHGGDIGGLVYLKVPKGMGKALREEEKDHYPASGFTEFAYGDKHDMRCGTHILRPVVGNVYVFPSWLRHFVYPFACEGERRSMSFNLIFRK